MGIAAINTTPAKVIREPRRLGSFRQLLDPLQVVAVQRLRTSEVHGDTVLHYAVLVENLIENPQRTAVVHHVVFRDDLKPIDHRLPGEDVIIMRNSQANADTVVGVPIETISRHMYSDAE